jgi:hypothetical protein
MGHKVESREKLGVNETLEGNCLSSYITEMRSVWKIFMRDLWNDRKFNENENKMKAGTKLKYFNNISPSSTPFEKVENFPSSPPHKLNFSARK